MTHPHNSIPYAHVYTIHTRTRTQSKISLTRKTVRNHNTTDTRSHNFAQCPSISYSASPGSSPMCFPPSFSISSSSFPELPLARARICSCSCTYPCWSCRLPCAHWLFARRTAPPHMRWERRLRHRWAHQRQQTRHGRGCSESELACQGWVLY